ncbi:MAG TPA: glycosyltransferase family 39 protein, partial [Thermoleophilaceae bacterium]
MARAHTLALLGIVLVGIAVRVAICDQSLFGDELFTSYVTEPDGLGGVLDRVREIESNPPLFSVLAWGGAQLGDPEVWIRLPSMLAGIALIPLIGALGTLIGDSRTGLTAAALVALSPFSTFFATEARAYATMTFLVALTTLALLCALSGRGRWWWAVFVVAAVAALYTHYTTAFPLGVQAVWALWQHRGQARALLFTHGLAVLLFLPWIPLIRENEAEQAIGGAFDLTPGSALSAMLRLVFGHAIESFD